MEELKPKLILTNSNKSNFNIGRYIFIILIFAIGFYFGYGYNSLDSDIILESKDQISKIADKKFTKLDPGKSVKPKPEKRITAQNVQAKDDNNKDSSSPGQASPDNNIEKHAKIINGQSSGLDTSYTLQIAAFETERKSSEVVKELANKGYNVYSISVVNTAGDRWNLVRLGNFETFEEAREFSELLLTSEGINSIIKSIEKSKVTSSTKYY